MGRADARARPGVDVLRRRTVNFWAVAGTLLEIENLGEQTLLYFFADALAGLGVPGEVWWTIFDLFTLAGAFLRVPDLIFGTLQGLQAHTLAEVVVPNEVGRTLEYLGAQALAEG